MQIDVAVQYLQIARFEIHRVHQLVRPEQFIEALERREMVRADLRNAFELLARDNAIAIPPAEAQSMLGVEDRMWIRRILPRRLLALAAEVNRLVQIAGGLAIVLLHPVVSGERTRHHALAT